MPNEARRQSRKAPPGREEGTSARLDGSAPSSFYKRLLGRSRIQTRDCVGGLDDSTPSQ